MEISPLFGQKAESGFLSDFDDQTEKTLQQVFGQLSLVGLIFIQMTAPRLFRVTPPKDNIKAVYDVVFDTFKGRLVEAGLVLEDQPKAEKVEEVAQ